MSSLASSSLDALLLFSRRTIRTWQGGSVQLYKISFPPEITPKAYIGIASGSAEVASAGTARRARITPSC